MKKWFLLIAMSLLMGNQSHRPQFYYVDMPVKERKDIQDLRMQGFDIAGVNYENQTVSLVMSEKELQESKHLRYSNVREVGRLDSEYKTPEQVKSALLESEKSYPDLVRLESIGKSVEGRDIWAVALTNQNSKLGNRKETILVDSMHHAREVMTVEVALDIIDYLTKNYEKDSKVRSWMDSYEIWVVPMVNPDGNEKVWKQNNMWRKNTQGGYGVDINRNYPYEWGNCNGSSGSKSSDTYRGASAGSEPETQALMGLVRRIQPKFNLSYHSYSELVIYPYGCRPQTVSEEDEKIYLETGRTLAKKLVRDSGNGSYKAGTAYDLLYNVDGGSSDWMYANEKVMSFVVELNGSFQGFQPSYKKWRDSTVERQRPGWMYLLDQMDKPGIKKN